MECWFYWKWNLGFFVLFLCITIYCWMVYISLLFFFY